MAVLAPIFFNISIIIVLSMLSRRSRYLGDLMVTQAHWSGSFVFIIAIALPALAGFVMGASKCATLLGHFFYTNMGHEKDITKTVAVWCALFIFAFILSGGV